MNLLELDKKLFFLINHSRHPVLDLIMPWMSDFKTISPILFIFFIWLLIKGTKRDRLFLIFLIIGVILTDAICARILKPLIGRPRPYLSLDHVILLKHGLYKVTNAKTALATMKMSLSWPSCHSSNVSFFGVFTALEYRWAAIAACIVIFLVSYSRIYLGAHYPSDVIGGILFGTAFAFLLRKIFTKISS
ncbi:phosphatase PAP2 family protein [Dissulfuribacter thermophilus]|nr:phosphatase PAP2 family protein [Dissulfuribacter thermophilus]